MIIDWNENVDNDAIYKRSPFYVLFQNISKGNKLDAGIKNKCFSDKLLKVILKKHLAFLPFWSGLLSEPGKRYSNDYIENYFGILKMEKEELYALWIQPTKAYEIYTKSPWKKCRYIKSVWNSIKCTKKKVIKKVYESLILNDFWTLDYSCENILDRYLSNLLVIDYFSNFDKRKRWIPSTSIDMLIAGAEDVDVNISYKFCIMPILASQHFMLI